MTIFKTIFAFLFTLATIAAQTKPNVIIVSEHETHTDQQGEIRAGQEKGVYWMLELAEDSEKDFTLRR